VGYAVAPPALTAELRKVHQFNTFSVSNSTQHGIARYLRARPQCGLDLADAFAARRQLLCEALAGCGFGLPRAAGSYFQLLDYSALSNAPDTEVCEQLLTGAGVASIPLSVFCQNPPPGMRLLRLCFAKRNATLREGARRLRAWAEGKSGC
jgi:methionine aminotransferase